MSGAERPGSARLFWWSAAGILLVHAALLRALPGLAGGADLLPHLRLIQLMAPEPALRSVYAPAYHAIGALVTPLVGLESYPRVFAWASTAALIGGFRYFQRAARLPDACSAVFVFWPYFLTHSWCLPKVESAGYALAFFGLGLLLRRRYIGVALALAATFGFHTASALFFGIAAGVLSLARRDPRGLLALAAGTLAAAPLFAAHVAAGCSLAEAFLFSRNDYLRVTSAWSSAQVWDRIALLASPPALVAAALGARGTWLRHRPLAILCAVVVALYLNELWLAPFATRTSLDLLRGLVILSLPVSISAGLYLGARPRLAPWVIGSCALVALADAALVVPRSCHVRPIAVGELRDLSVARCAFRWWGPHIVSPRRESGPSQGLGEAREGER